MSYLNLLGFKYELELDGESISPTDPRRKTITSITVTLRRNESSSLSIQFLDSGLYWHNVFSKSEPVKIRFKGYNLDGSAPEEFEGYCYKVSPLTDLNNYSLEAMFLDVPPKMYEPAQTTRNFENMSRKSAIIKLASEMGYKTSIEEDEFINDVEEDLYFNINESVIQFVARILDEIGYRVSIHGLTTWVVTPKIPDGVTAKGIHSNIGGDGSLLSFTPSFSPFVYEEYKKDESSSASAVDPDTKQIEEESSKGGSTSQGILGKAKMYLDTITNQWKETK